MPVGGSSNTVGRQGRALRALDACQAPEQLWDDLSNHQEARPPYLTNQWRHLPVQRKE